MRDKVIIITGASGGIGAALARHLSAVGAKVALAARSRERLEAVAADCSDALVVPTDITDQAACQQLVDQTVNHYGRLDVLVNNAGMSMLARFDEVADLSIYEKLMQINYFGAVYCTHAALPHLKKTRGLIVGISSLAGKTGVPLRTGYSASKHALQGFFDCLRIELMGTGVDVTMISPGFVDTDIREHSFGADGKPLGYNPLEKHKLMTADECARQIIKAIEERRREVLMGTQGKFLMLGKLLLPKLVDRMAKRRADKK